MHAASRRAMLDVSKDGAGDAQRKGDAMVLTESTMLELGTPAPEFDLPDPSGDRYGLGDFSDAKGLVVAFICNHCPYVKHLKEEFVAFVAEYQARGLAVVAISSNDIDAYPEDAPALMQEDSDAFGFTFPYLFDETQEAAKAYRAVCTPEFYLFDGDRRLAYRGQFDSSRYGGGGTATGADLRAAADAVLAGQAYEGPQQPGIGCSIKWKPGAVPDYFG